ncbi:EndoU domain-containing protein [Cupriavidus taiwanensis]|uniref:two-partner secretion domain-containing protein n=1 Tax=Cupriavidus taiwanensis TaxID=164546 RepID=UPI000E14EA73|nr:EndoU domain-containing protein [Cupriavidus taiwanensis]SPC10168.1 putative hemagglutinin-related protein [Cupriavidus taiwanensis]
MHRDRQATLLPATSRGFPAVYVMPAGLPSAEPAAVSLADRGRRSMLARGLAGLVAVVMWVGPVQVSLQQARQAAGVLAAGAVATDALAVHGGAVRQGLLRWAVAHLPVTVSFGPVAAYAAPITDPNALVRFTPSIGATSGPGAPAGGVPTVTITTPNAQGISLNQYRAFVVDPVGLIMNNSTIGGGTFLGGQVGANPKLAASGPANLIINQVTSQTPAQIHGTVEVFGAPAGLVVAAPGGVYTSGAGFTNTTQVTLTTGTPQWLSSAGAATSFDAAAAAGFLVEGGRVQIANPAPHNPNGVGIEGTVGNINLIADTIAVDAALYAGNQINLVAGRQIVAPVNGTFTTTAAGPNHAASNATATDGLAIDATAFGAMTAGQIRIISTAAGMGVRADGNLAASANHLTIDSAGNLKVGNTYARQAVALNAAGDVTATGNGQGEGGYTVSAGRDATLGGTLESGKGVTVSAAGSINGAGSVKAQEAVKLAAGGSVDVGGAVSGSQITVSTTGDDGRGDIRLGGDVTSPGVIQLNAARDTAIDGSALSAGDLNLSTRRNLTINGAAGSTGGNVALTGVTGSVTTTGNVVLPGALTVSAGTDVDLGGKVLATGPIQITAHAGSITTSGEIGSNNDLTLTAAQHVTVGGEAQSAGAATITATDGSATIHGALTADGDATITAGQDANIAGSISSGGNTAIRATGGSASVSGALVSIGDTSVTAARNATLTGRVQAGGNLRASAGQTLSVAGLDWVGGDAILRGADINVGSVPEAANVIKGTLDASATNGLTLVGGTQAASLRLAGTTVANQGTAVALQQLRIDGGTVSNSGTLTGDVASITAADLTNHGTLGGRTVTVNVTNGLANADGLLVGAQSLNVTTAALTSNQGGTVFAGDLSGKNPATGDLTFTVTGADGSFNNAAGQLLAGNDLTLNTLSQTFDPSGAASGTLNANGVLTLAALAIRNTGTWDVPGTNVVLSASQGITNTGTIQKAGDLTLATGGALDNSGQIVGGSNVSLSAGNLSNTGVIHANNGLTLAGNVTNAGTVEALGKVMVTGGDYDNRGGTTQAGGDLRFDISGTLDNLGSVLGAKGNVHIAAASVINDRTAPVDAGSTTGKVTNDALLSSTIIGSYQPWLAGGNCDTCAAYDLGPTQTITLADVLRKPDGSIALAFGPERIYVGTEGSAAEGYYWHLLPANVDPAAVPYLASLPGIAGVPTVDRTIVSQTDGTAGQIISGGSVDLSAASLSNKGGIISASRDVTLKVDSLDNGRSATLVNSVTDTVNQGELSAFLAQLRTYAETRSGPKFSESGPLVFGLPPSMDGCDSCPAPPPWSPVSLPTGTSGAPTQSTASYQLGKAGQILAGGDLSLIGSGDLTNAGDLAAAGKVTITTPGTFTNQGGYESKLTTTAGCLPGAQTCREADAHVDTLTWQQTANTVSAGKTLAINAATIQNLNGALVAWGDAALTASSSVTNQAGAIQSLAGDISITAPTLLNKTMDPVTLHKSYGNMNPSYAGGCNPGGTYKESNCSANETTAAGPAGVISAARDVNLSGTTLTNTGALITGGRDVTIKVDAPVNNNSIALNAEWVGRWVEKTGAFSADKRHDTGGTAVLGSIESGIQAGNKLSVNAGGQIANTGNLMGAAVDLTGAALLNGYTSPTQPTPPSTASRQVIPLGPAPVPAGSLPSTTPVADPTPPWQFNPVIVTTPAAPDTGKPNTVQWHFNASLGGKPVPGPTLNSDRAQYVNPSPATAILAGVTPDSLLKQLPPELRPGNVSFYYDPYAEGQKLQQAALQQTGQASFINGLAWDNEHQLSVTDQQKLVLYKNAADYAKEHSIVLGTALTQQQINELDKPLLWYVQQQVPDPSCNTAASTVCPSVLALVPQVYLPDGYAQRLNTPTGGTIAGDNVSLDFAGQIRNSGQVLAGDTLKVRAGSIDNSPNVVDIGTSAYRMQGGWNVVTGTVVQPGGFMTAMHMDIEADRITAVNDAFRVMSADGSVDVDATKALVGELKANLGLNYTDGTVSDDIHQQFIKEEKGFGPLGQIVAIAAAVAISIATAGAGSALVGAATSTAFAATATGAALSAAASGLIAGTLSSMASQLILAGSLDMGAALKAGVVSGLTAGLAQGALGALGLGNAGITSIGDNIAKGSWEAVQANLGDYLGASIVRSAISAGVSTVAYGGSYGQAFASGLVRDAAAVFANAIGVTLPGIGTDGASTGTVLANMAGHALLGCATQSLLGGDCAGGAVGGAASALAVPLIRDALYADSPVLNYSDDPSRQAITVGLATLIGGTVGLLLGRDATSASLAAQNEALNNATARYQNVKDPRFQANVKALGDCVDPVACRSNAAFLEAQIGSLSEDKIIGMCGNNADCMSARYQERSLYQLAYRQALVHQDANVAARDYLSRASDAQGKGYSTAELDTALQRFQAGVIDPNSPVDAFIEKSIVGNVALFGAIKGVTGVDSDGGGSSRGSKKGSPIDYDHVVGADYTKAGRPTGGHTLLNGDVRIVPGTESVPDSTGVYKATIQVPDPTNPGQWVTKTNNASTNTMFPKSWDEPKIKAEVDAAWHSPNKVVIGEKWSSVTPSGVKVEGYTTPRVTVYPVYQPPKIP